MSHNQKVDADRHFEGLQRPVRPAAAGQPLSFRAIFDRMIASEVRAGRCSTSDIRHYLRFARELGLPQADAEDILIRRCQEHNQDGCCRKLVGVNDVCAKGIDRCRPWAYVVTAIMSAVAAGWLVGLWLHGRW